MVNKWKTVELGDLVTLASGGSFPLKYQSNTNGKYSFFKVSDMNLPINQKYLIESKNTIDEEVKEKLKSKIHPKSTIVFPKVGAALLTNKRRLLVEPSAFDNNIMGIIPNENVDFEYLYYYMLTVDFRKLSQTGAIPSINNTIVSSLPVDLPINKNEQQKIASILSSVDEAIEKTEKIIQQVTRLKRGTLERLMKYGINHKDFKNTLLGQIPKEWTIKTFNELVEDNVIASIQDGNHGSIHPKSNDYVDEGIPFIMANNLKHGKVDVENCSFISKKQADNLKKGFSYPGDILLTHKGTIGRTAIVTNVSNYVMLTPQVTYYRVYDETILLKEYLLLYFQSNNYQETLKKLSAQSTRSYIGLTNQRKLSIPLPNISEQQEIVEIINSVSDKLKNELSNKTTLENLKKGLMQQLLTGKVRVPSNESEEVPQ